MLDWWQAALLSVISAIAGGSIGLVTAYYTQRWTNSAAREAEKRQSKRKMEEEERQAARQLRRERIQLILDFLDAAKTFRAGEVRAGLLQSTERDLEKAFESNREHPLFLEAKRYLLNKSLGDEPDALQLISLCVVASASAPTSEIQQGVISRVFLAAVTPREKASESLDDATSAAEGIIEKYLTVV